MISENGWLYIGISQHIMKSSICIEVKDIYLGVLWPLLGFKKTVFLSPENDKLNRENYPF
jgi:hypothetical protein